MIPVGVWVASMAVVPALAPVARPTEPGVLLIVAAPVDEAQLTWLVRFWVVLSL